MPLQHRSNPSSRAPAKKSKARMPRRPGGAYAVFPAGQAKGEVEWVSRGFGKLPYLLGLKEGRMVHPAFANPEGKSLRFAKKEAWTGDAVIQRKSRSMLLAQMYFSPKPGELYRDFDVKGIGHLEFGKGRKGTRKAKVEVPSKLWGISEMENIEQDRRMSEKLEALGIRVVKPVALVRLDEIFVGPERTRVGDHDFQYQMGGDVRPGLLVRAFGVKTRVADLRSLDAGRNERKRMLQDARHFVARELRKGKGNFSPRDYLAWFAQAFGENMRRLHAGGYVNPYLTSHNVTLDCRLVDLAGLKHGPDVPAEKKYGEDKERMEGVLHAFCAQFPGEEERAKRIFRDAYFGKKSAT